MKLPVIWFIAGGIAGAVLIMGGRKAMVMTSGNEFCVSCHIHPEADASWKKSVHYDTESGYRVACVDCHLPPEGEGYLRAKAVTGFRDLWSYWTKDSASFNWEERRRLEVARGHVFNAGCVKCHENLFPGNLSKEGEDAHLYYTQAENTPDLHCINCHLNAGHYIEGYTHVNSTFGTVSAAPKEIFTAPALVSGFSNYTETIPGSPVSFNMVAIPGGKFRMGSPPDEPFRKGNECQEREVEISPFFMAETEVTWDEYLAFYAQTATVERTSDIRERDQDGGAEPDAITGPTPPYGQPDQNWGLGQRPAITMTYHAAEAYCKWLSSVTGKKFRLPTEAEWEYACRAGTQGPYFFPGDPDKFEKRGMKAKFSKNDTAVINTYIIYRENTPSKPQLPEQVKPNPYGLRNMLGNVAEYCSDWYREDPLSDSPGGIVKNPGGPETGTEHVIRGGSFLDMAGGVRCAVRDHTKTESWLKTDPQIPKSTWWYSDCVHVGFRVVCEYEEGSMSHKSSGGEDKPSL